VGGDVLIAVDVGSSMSSSPSATGSMIQPK
jgi:hypothetical protein